MVYSSGMDTLNCIACFVHSAKAGSFAAAARHLGLTPAAVGKNVARLEAELGVRLFQRSTRSLSLTESGEQFLSEAAGGLHSLEAAMANLANARGQPAGVLRVSMGQSFGRHHVVPLLDEFLRRYPAVRPDWHFDDRPVDLIVEGFDAAIGGGFELPPRLVARTLAPAHRVLLASPGYLECHGEPNSPAQLGEHEGILIRSPQTGRIRPWMLRNRQGLPAAIDLRLRMSFSDPEAACQAAQMDLGITLVSTAHALPYLDSGRLCRVLPDWYVDAGFISIYFAAQKLLPQKTRVFVDFLVEQFRSQGLDQRFSAL
ncbi:transcriptional regulator, LysR family [Azotobacter beijerinckii]|uniref:Transcriptional regulator, LysR family n=3 Tax=Azotobacter beijerinckii TaxID=170623 RepID=A0A1H6YUL2_9GAMM|nr:transcriptional regulator, LysR family [Azotobacter beijerinckii]SFB57302.1 transcriptional regulator, LysR family [Azotobacter beijerinckii]SFL07038.1 transcriptional regulator, LysR family [Azotobacter beijerinckii]